MSIITRAGRFLGSVPDAPDERDHRYNMPDSIQLPVSTGNRGRFPPPYHQASLGSCASNAGAMLLQDLYPGFLPSRLALYYRARELEGTVEQDNGTQLRSVMKVMQKWGVPSEDVWPYRPDNFLMTPPAPQEPADRIIKYARLTGGREMMACLAQGFPFVLAMQIPEHFDDADIAAHGVLRLPTVSDTGGIGRHAVIVVDYDARFLSNPDFLNSGVSPAQVETTHLFAINSWGSEWGRNGGFWLPLSAAVHPTSDAWFGHKLITNVDEGRGPMVGGIKIEGEFVKT